jgi:hypothetical protein
LRHHPPFDHGLQRCAVPAHQIWTDGAGRKVEYEGRIRPL